jgi:arylsulfatase A-like enzyme
VVLVVVDTLRADQLGCYGRKPSLTVNIDAFQRKAVQFDTAIAQAPSTLPSVASILTSAIPQHHGASITRAWPLAQDHLTLAEVLRGRGFVTAAFHGGGQLDATFGLSQGFDVYATPGASDDPDGYVDRFAPSVEAGLAWLEAQRGKRFFLLLHTYECHHPYTPSPSDLAAAEAGGYPGPLPPAIPIALLRSINAGHTAIGPADLDHIRHAHEGEIRSVDRAFGEIVAGLRRLGRYDETLVVFTADHGEEFGEHGKVGWHGHTLFDELLHIPLLVKYPHSWRGGSRLGDQVRGIDIAPAILRCLGVPIPEAFEGRDLSLYVAGGPPPPPYAVSEIDGKGSAIRSREWKWAEGALYDLARDPGETRNVAAEHPGVVRKLRRIRQEIVSEDGMQELDALQVSPELRERLRALGYAE